MTNVGFENMSQFYHSDISTICFSGAFKLPCNPCNGRTQIAEGGWSCAVASGHSFGLFMSVVSDVALQQQQTPTTRSNRRLFVSVDQGSIVTADCVTCCGQVPVMIVTSATGASADLLRHEKNIINIYRAAGDHLPHRSSH